jgi:malonyl-CoA O-methyltransferase
MEINSKKKNLQRAFNRAAKTYDNASYLQKEICERLLDRADMINIQPDYILDLGAGTGYGAFSLLKKYQNSSIVALDFSESMLDSLAIQNNQKSLLLLNADFEKIPVQSSSIDLVFSSSSLQWALSREACFHEIKRVLSPQGIFLFTTYGPDTLKELRECWGTIDDHEHVNAFTDMHHIGDELLEHSFQDPVVDKEILTVKYETVLDLQKDLKGIGSSNALENKTHSLTSPNRMHSMYKEYEKLREKDGKLPATFEVIYGHAWQGSIPIDLYK